MIWQWKPDALMEGSARCTPAQQRLDGAQQQVGVQGCSGFRGPATRPLDQIPRAWLSFHRR